MSRRGLLIGTAATVLLAGCASDAAGGAQQLADEEFPGQLRVLEARTELGGGPIPRFVTRATYAVNDDPDALVEVAELSAAGLRRAVELGRWAAADLRRLENALAAERILLVARSAPRNTVRGGTVLVEVTLTEQTRADVVARLDRALTSWHRESLATSELDLLGIGILDEGASVGAPVADADLPRMATLALPARWDRLQHRRHLTASVSATKAGGAGADALTVRSSLLPVLDEARSAALDEAVRAGVDAWLRSTNRDGVASGAVLAWSHLLAVDLHTVRTYAHVCPETTPACGLGSALGLVGCTVDLAAMRVTEVTAISPRRNNSGGLVLPIEPDRVPA